MTGSTRQPSARWWGIRLAAAALFLLGIYLARVPLLTSVAAVMSVEDELRPADLIFLLGGDIHNRPAHAARLFRQGLAPRIVLARVEDTPPTLSGHFPNETDAAVRWLRDLGIPDSAIVVLRRPGGVTSTTDEARELRKYLEGNPARRVIMATSRYHTRRARWNLRRELEGLPVEILAAGVDHHHFHENNWWRSEMGLIRYVEEYLKFLHNWIYR